MIENTKKFHISQILAIYTGVTLLNSEQITWPKESTLWGRRNSFELFLDIMEHVSGQKIANAKKPEGYDKALFDEIFPSVRDELVSKFSWLVYVPYDYGSLIGSGLEKTKNREKWVASVAAQQGTEWFDVQGKTMKLLPPAQVREFITYKDLPTPNFN